MTDRLISASFKMKHFTRHGAWALLGLSAITLASCAGKPIQSEALVKTQPAEQAMVMPPPAGPAIVNIVERRFNNAVSQDIHLATSASTPGQNLFKIQLIGMESAIRHGDNSLGASSITDAKISAEMRAALPRTRMVKSQFYVQNNYGPFGYAFGRGAGTDLCLYAWQQIRSDKGTISPLANYGVIQLRLRLCEAGATETRLLSTMYNFTITAAVDDLGWNPYGNPRGLNPDIGSNGAPIYPRPTASEPIVQTLPPRRADVPVRRTPARPARQISPPVTPVYPAEPDIRRPIVPAPTGAGYTMPAGNPVVRTTMPSAADPSATPVQRVTVPSPSCSMTTDGADIVCR